MLALLATIALLVADPPKAPGDNAATGYAAAMEILLGGPLSKAGTKEQRLLTPQESQAIMDIASPQDITPEVRAILVKARPMLDLVREAAKRPVCDFDLDRSQGFSMLMPHLAPMRELTRILRAETAMHLADGDAGAAVASLAAVTGLASHAGQDNVLIASLVGSAISANGDGTLQMAIDQGAIDPAQAKAMIATLERLQGTDPFHYASSIDSESEMFAATARKAVETPEGMAELGALVAGGSNASELAGLPRDQALEQLAVADGMFAQAADAFRDPDPESAQAKLTELETQMKEAGPLVALLMPNFRWAYDAKLRTEATVAARIAQLRDIASGKTPPMKLANAATWYLAAARAATQIDPEQQNLFEACRVVTGVLDPMVASDVARALQKRRAAVVEPILHGSQAGRCAFPRRVGDPPIVILPEYAAGLRAAVRVLLADALLMARDAERGGPEGTSIASGASGAANPPPVDGAGVLARPAPSEGGDAASRAEAWRKESRRLAAESVDRVIAAIRLVEHVSADASIAHAVLAQSILDEVREALAGLVTIRWWDDNVNKAVQPAVAALNRVDPVGHRRGLAADREKLLTRLSGSHESELRTERRKLLMRFDADALASLAMAQAHAWRQVAAQAPAASTTGAAPAAGAAPTQPAEPPLSPPFECGSRDDAVLLDLSDLYMQDACAALSDSAKSLMASGLFAAQDVEALRRAEPISSATLPKVLEAVRRTGEAPDVLRAVDEFVRTK